MYDPERAIEPIERDERPYKDALYDALHMERDVVEERLYRATCTRD